MAWRVYRIVFRLRSPLHIGWGRVGNLERTRPYVTGRALWGALTMRLTRDVASVHSPVADSHEYQRVGEQVHRYLAFTYLYPALRLEDDYQVALPWENENIFRRRFLSTYQGTALSYPFHSAVTGMLHEVEFISYYTLDTGEQVFLVGYIFEREGTDLAWRSAFKRLQIGGERGYGWGDVELVEVNKVKNNRLFTGELEFKGENDLPILHLPACNGSSKRLLAHTIAKDLPAIGDVEPLVGREWRSNHKRFRYAGQYITFNDICFTPGSIVNQELDFLIGKFGVWQVIDKKESL